MHYACPLGQVNAFLQEAVVAADAGPGKEYRLPVVELARAFASWGAKRTLPLDEFGPAISNRYVVRGQEEGWEAAYILGHRFRFRGG